MSLTLKQIKEREAKLEKSIENTLKAAQLEALRRQKEAEEERIRQEKEEKEHKKREQKEKREDFRREFISKIKEKLNPLSWFKDNYSGNGVEEGPENREDIPSNLSINKPSLWMYEEHYLTLLASYPGMETHEARALEMHFANPDMDPKAINKQINKQFRLYPKYYTPLLKSKNLRLEKIPNFIKPVDLLEVIERYGIKESPADYNPIFKDKRKSMGPDKPYHVATYNLYKAETFEMRDTIDILAMQIGLYENEILLQKLESQYPDPPKEEKNDNKKISKDTDDKSDKPETTKPTEGNILEEEQIPPPMHMYIISEYLSTDLDRMTIKQLQNEFGDIYPVLDYYQVREIDETGKYKLRPDIISKDDKNTKKIVDAEIHNHHKPEQDLEHLVEDNVNTNKFSSYQAQIGFDEIAHEILKKDITNYTPEDFSYFFMISSKKGAALHYYFSSDNSQTPEEIYHVTGVNVLGLVRRYGLDTIERKINNKEEPKDSYVKNALKKLAGLFKRKKPQLSPDSIELSGISEPEETCEDNSQLDDIIGFSIQYEEPQPEEEDIQPISDKINKPKTYLDHLIDRQPNHLDPESYPAIFKESMTSKAIGDIDKDDTYQVLSFMQRMMHATEDTFIPEEAYDIFTDIVARFDTQITLNERISDILSKPITYYTKDDFSYFYQLDAKQAEALHLYYSDAHNGEQTPEMIYQETGINVLSLISKYGLEKREEYVTVKEKLYEGVRSNHVFNWLLFNALTFWKKKVVSSEEISPQDDAIGLPEYIEPSGDTNCIHITPEDEDTTQDTESLDKKVIGVPFTFDKPERELQRASQSKSKIGAYFKRGALALGMAASLAGALGTHFASEQEDKYAYMQNLNDRKAIVMKQELSVYNNLISEQKKIIDSLESNIQKYTGTDSEESIRYQRQASLIRSKIFDETHKLSEFERETKNLEDKYDSVATDKYKIESEKMHTYSNYSAKVGIAGALLFATGCLSGLYRRFIKEKIVS
jgi:hypothetical protein